LPLHRKASKKSGSVQTMTMMMQCRHDVGELQVNDIEGINTLTRKQDSTGKIIR